MSELQADILILIPIFNDWESGSILLKKLDAALATRQQQIQVVFVNDGSSTEPPPEILSAAPKHLLPPQLLDLRRNLGNQRAIAISMAWLHDHAKFHTLVIMDGDGEDDPADVPKLLDLLARQPSDALVFAERTRRTDSLIFKFFYRLYRLTHVLLTGQWYNVGNFSAIAAAAVDRLVVTPELWNHYPATALKTRLPVCTLPLARAKRYAGTSSMNFASLAVHGLAALSTYGEIIGVRVMMTSLYLAGLTVAALALLAGLRLGTSYSMPAWSAYAVVLLLMALLQMIVLAVIFILIVLAGRQAMPFIPIREYGYFVRGLRTRPDR